MHHATFRRLSSALPVFVALMASFPASPAVAADSAPAALSPDAALARLKDGNHRFATDASEGQPINRTRRDVLSKGQAPYAIVLSCADSRVPPELIFNVGLGDIFVVRTAGEVVDHAVLASVEYAAEHLHAPLLLVMGHESCGAVKSSIEVKESMGPNLDYLLAAIKPAVTKTAWVEERERVKAAILANVDQVIGDTMAKSELLRHLVEHGKLKVAGAYYELASGTVTFREVATTTETASGQGSK